MAFDPDAYLAKKQPGGEAGQAPSAGFDPDSYLKKYGIETPAPEPGFFGRLFGGKPSPVVPSEGGGDIVSPEEAITPLPREPAEAPTPGVSIGDRLIGGAKYIAGTEPEKRGSLVGDVVAGVERANVGAAGVFRALAESAAPILDPITGTVLPENPLRRIASEFERLGVESEARAQARAPKEPQDTLSAGVSSGVQSLAQNILAIPMAILPGGQPAAMVMLSSNTGGQAYQDARKKGLSPEKAIPYAVSQASIEYATEVMPLTRLISDINQKTGFGKLLMNQIIREVPGEQVATILQDMNDWAVLNPEKTANQYLAERPEAAAQTLIATIVGVGGNVLAGKGLQMAMGPSEVAKPAPAAPAAPTPAPGRIEPTLAPPPEEAPVEAAAAEEAPVAPEAPAEAQPTPPMDFVNPDTNMGSKITQLQGGQAAGQFAVTAYDLDSGMPLSTVRIFKTPEEAEAYAQDVVGVAPAEAAPEATAVEMPEEEPTAPATMKPPPPVETIMENFGVGKSPAQKFLDAYTKKADLYNRFQAGEEVGQELTDSMVEFNNAYSRISKIANLNKARTQGAEGLYRNKNQQQVIEKVMANYGLTDQDVAGLIQEGRIKLGKDGKFTASSVESLRTIGEIQRGGKELKKALTPTLPEARPGLPVTAEEQAYIAQREAEASRLSAELQQKSQLTKENNLYNFFYYGPQSKQDRVKNKPRPDNRLDMSEMLDITPDKSFNFLRKKGGAFVSDFVSSGQLNDWLPYEMRIDGSEDSVALGEKESAGTEYIKDALRNRDFLPYETKMELEQLGRSLDSIENEIRQEADLEELRDILAEIAETEGVADIESAIASFPEGRGVEPAAAPILSQYTAAEEESRLARAEEDRAAAEAKAIADREREVFALTPQVAERQAAPTGDLFGARGLAEQPARAAPAAPATDTGLFQSTTEPVGQDPATERVDRNTGIQQPPVLEKPDGYKARKGRQDQVAFAARLLAAGRISKEQYDDYVDYYMPVAKVPLERLEAPLSPEQLRTVLKLPKVNKEDSKIDAPVADGTRVGLRMDIPALVEAGKRGMSGSVVSIHQGTDPNKSSVGKNLSYKSAGALRNAQMAIRNENTAIKVAESLEGTEGQKAPQQTIEGNWVNMSPDQVMAAIRENFNNPDWVQVGFDPLRHSFFYSRTDMRPIVAADEVLQVGRFVLAKNPTYAPREQFLYDITQASTGSQYNVDRSPSFTREFDRLNKMYLQGKVGADVVVDEMDQVRHQIINERAQRRLAERKRGAEIVKEKLLAAKRRGDLTPEAVDLAEWFINQNPDLATDLGISLRQPMERAGVAGQYNPLSRIAQIIKGSSSATAPTHEILHHLERMMPEDIQRPIQQSWMRSFLRSKSEAEKSGDYALKKYYDLLSNYHFGSGNETNLERASELIERGAVAYEHYQNFNPSEFWAVNASRIVKGRFDTRGAALTRLKQWLSELVQKIKSIFGARSDASIIRALDSLAKSDGKFVTGSMLGEAGVYNSVVRQNVFGGPAPNPMWGRPDDSKADDAIFTIQDKLLDTKRVIQKIQEAVGNIEERWNAYLQEELYHGRTAKRTNDFLSDELTPLLKDMQRQGITMEQLEEFLHNNTAEERNIQIAKVNPNMPDGGSGIMTADAQAYLNNLSPSERAKLSSLAQKVYDIIRNTQKILVDSGLEKQSTIDTWNKAYKNYVPLMREESDYEVSNIGRGVGQGFNVRGASSKRATGSSRNVIDILANIAMQRERAIVRSEKLRVSQAVYGLAVQYPNPSFWLAIDPKTIKDPGGAVNDLVALGINPADAANIIKEPTIKTVDPVTNTVVERVNPLLRGADNVLAVRVNGSDKFVFFNTQDPRALRMVEALKNLDADQLSRALSIVGRVTRYFSAVRTQYNPIFGIVNFIRDVKGAMLHLSTTQINDMKSQILQDSLPALRGIYADIRSRRKGAGPKTGTWAKLWEEFQIEGGQTGFRDQFSRSEERADALAKSLTQLSQGKLKQGARAIFDWLSDYNETLENAVRLAAYKAALDKNLSKAQAASIAKNLTVNFNRKGQIGKQMGALYSFFNSSVQGTARMYETLKGPAGKKIIYGGLLLGSAQAMLLAAAGFDEDEPPDFVKEKNIVIPLFSGKKYLAIPMPLGFNVIPNFGRVMTEWSMSGFKDTGKRVGQLTGSVLDAFNPIGNAGWSFQTFAPTIVDPMVAIFENKDWTGKPIAKKDIASNDPTPGYTRAKDAASWFSKQLSYYLNFATGGTKYQPGLISPTPDQIDYLIGQATGGIGQEILKTEQSIRGVITGEEIPSYKIPLAGRFYGNAQEAAGVRDKFYRNIEMLNRHENEIKGRQKHREDVQGYIADHPEARLFQQANAIERDIQKMRKHKSELIERGADKAEIKRIEDMMTARMKILNDRVNQTRP